MALQLQKFLLEERNALELCLAFTVLQVAQTSIIRPIAQKLLIEIDHQSVFHVSVVSPCTSGHMGLSQTPDSKEGGLILCLPVISK